MLLDILRVKFLTQPWLITMIPSLTARWGVVSLILKTGSNFKRLQAVGA